MSFESNIWQHLLKVMLAVYTFDFCLFQCHSYCLLLCITVLALCICFWAQHLQDETLLAL